MEGVVLAEEGNWIDALELTAAYKSYEAEEEYCQQILESGENRVNLVGELRRSRDMELAQDPSPSPPREARRGGRGGRLVSYIPRPEDRGY